MTQFKAYVLKRVDGRFDVVSINKPGHEFLWRYDTLDNELDADVLASAINKALSIQRARITDFINGV